MRLLPFLSLAALAVLSGLLAPESFGATALSRFHLSPVLLEHETPTAVAFGSDGRVFVAEKSGRVFAYSSLQDRRPKLLLDLRPRVHDYWDRGLLAVELDPDFPQKPYLYLLYTLDAPPGVTPPVWNDSCPDPPGAMRDGCVVAGVLSRVRVGADNVLASSEQILADNWCHQFTSHVVGDLAFGPNRALYVSAGEGSSWLGVDYGQFGGSPGSPTPPNPCNDPPREGGALRAQDLLSGGDPVGFDGTVLGLDPDSGRPLMTNPLFGGDPADDAVLAYGLRNPYRLAMRPGSRQLFVADPGWTRYEEVNRLLPGRLANFGWPCYEGSRPQPAFAASALPLCELLYRGERGQAQGALTAPFLGYSRSNPPGTACDGRGSAPSGLEFYRRGPYPAAYDGALFLVDYSSRCLFAYSRDETGAPRRPRLVARDLPAVDLERGPNGDLFAVDVEAGRVWRLRYFAGNRPPLVTVKATPQAGALPLDVSFQAVAKDPDGQRLSYRWDLDGDGSFDDATGPRTSYTYRVAGRYPAAVRVVDSRGAAAVAVVSIEAGNQRPLPVMDFPAVGYRFKANEHLYFAGRAEDPEDGSLPDGFLSWSFILHHCVGSSCHAHPLEARPSAGWGGVTVPDHPYPSHLEVLLTATDSQGASRTVSRRIYPQTAALSLRSQPLGLKLLAGERAARTPFSYRALLDGNVTVSAPLRQTLNGASYSFSRWSDGGARTHSVTAGQIRELVAYYRRG